MMFSPLNGTGTPSLSSLGGVGTGGQASLLDRATTMLANNRKEAKEANERRSQRPHVPAAGRDAGVGDPTDPSRAGSMTHDEATKREAEPRPRRQPQETVPSFAVVATFEMKKVRQRGLFKIDLNKFTTDSLTLRFDENIGDLSQLRSDARHFREINLDDPLYRQREINVMVDGLNAQDFGQYINFVTVQMRKKHASGEESFDEVRIDRTNFNQEGAVGEVHTYFQKAATILTTP